MQLGLHLLGGATASITLECRAEAAMRLRHWDLPVKCLFAFSLLAAGGKKGELGRFIGKSLEQIE